MHTTITTRRLKLQPKQTNFSNNFHSVVPQLTLQGNWFMEAGFMPGEHVNVQVADGKLTITTCTV